MPRSYLQCGCERCQAAHDADRMFFNFPLADGVAVLDAGERLVPRYEDQPGAVSAEPYSPIGYKDRYGLPTGRDERKAIPLASGLFDYFPHALASVAALSKVGNDQHNPGKPLHWSREKSSDHADTLLRHQLERGKRDTDKVRHATKVAWRALAQLQIEIENDGGAL